MFVLLVVWFFILKRGYGVGNVKEVSQNEQKKSIICIILPPSIEKRGTNILSFRFRFCQKTLYVIYLTNIIQIKSTYWPGLVLYRHFVSHRITKHVHAFTEFRRIAYLCEFLYLYYESFLLRLSLRLLSTGSAPPRAEPHQTVLRRGVFLTRKNRARIVFMYVCGASKAH